MGMTDKRYKKYLGYKFYKINDDDSVNMIRIIRVSDYNNQVTIRHMDTNEEEKLNITSLKGYTPLEPFGTVSFADVGIEDTDHKMDKDVIISMYKLLDLKLDFNIPYAICRQSINDFFAANLYPDQEIAGVCASRDNFPAGEDFRIMEVASTIYKYEMANIYYEDTLDTILDCINTKPYDNTLRDLQNRYIDSHGLLNRNHKNSIHGWCKDLKSLLIDNNFMTDLDEMRGIQAVDFNIAEHLVDDKIGDTDIKKFDPEVLEFFRVTFRVPAVSTIVIDYDHDINMADFNNTNYIKMRDNTDKLYIVAYKNQGEYLDKELEEWKNKPNISDQIKLAFYNKYYGLDKSK